MNIDDYIETKRCTESSRGGCGQRLPIDQFYSHPGKLTKAGKRGKSTISARCKACTSAINSASGQNRYRYKREKPDLRHTGPARDSIEYKYFCT